MARKKQQSNLIGWVILGLMGLAIVQFGILGNPGRAAAPTQRSASAQPAPPAAPAPSPAPASSASVPLNTPRFVNVASLNVRHAPSANADLIMALPRGTPLRVLDRKNGWLLIDLNPTLEGWVSERLTTTESPKQAYRPPAALQGSK